MSDEHADVTSVRIAVQRGRVTNVANVIRQTSLYCKWSGAIMSIESPPAAGWGAGIPPFALDQSDANTIIFAQGAATQGSSPVPKLWFEDQSNALDFIGAYPGNPGLGVSPNAIVKFLIPDAPSPSFGDPATGTRYNTVGRTTYPLATDPATGLAVRADVPMRSGIQRGGSSAPTTRNEQIAEAVMQIFDARMIGIWGTFKSSRLAWASVAAVRAAVAGRGRATATLASAPLDHSYQTIEIDFADYPPPPAVTIAAAIQGVQDQFQQGARRV